MNTTTLRLCVLCALATSVGWGFRGDYGHEAGAMVPGALVALAVCLASGREDWCNRASLLAFLGAIGWAFGGSMSYGRVVGYTAHVSYPDVAYGYACLFVIGALWGGIGAGVLGLGLTQPRSEFQRAVGPLVTVYLVWQVLDFSGATRALIERWSLYDTDWVAASSALIVALIYAPLVPSTRRACVFIALLAVGWWVGFSGLTLGLGLRMTPPRGDNWAGCLGLYFALMAWLWFTRNRVALLLSCYGLLFGGIGFSVGDFVQMLGRAQWGPIGAFEALQRLDYWKWMEQGFGFIMGFGIGLGASRFVRQGLTAPPEDASDRSLRGISLVFLLILMPWHNLFKNVRRWHESKHLGEGLLGLEPRGWFLLVGLALSAMVLVAIVQHSRRRLEFAPASGFGRAQLLFLVILWISVLGAFMQAFPSMSRKGTLFVHVSFWLTAVACSIVVLLLPSRPNAPPVARSADDGSWSADRGLILAWLCVPILILGMAYLSKSTHSEPLPGSHRRFETTIE